MTTAAEIVYLAVWGLVLFPEGSLSAKIVWTLTCGIAMGAVIGSGTLVFVDNRHGGASAFWLAASIMALVGVYCTWLCSRIDLMFSYFGGAEHGTLFIAGGVIPAIAGGLLYGWFLYGPLAQRRENAGNP